MPTELQRQHDEGHRVEQVEGDRPFQVIFLTGRVLTCTWAQAWRCLSDRYSVVFFGITLYLIGVLSYYWAGAVLPWVPTWQLFISISSSVPLAFVFICVSIYLMSRASKRFPGVPVPIPLAVLIGVVGSVFLPGYILERVSPLDWSSVGVSSGLLLKYYLTALALEALYSVFVLPYTKVYAEIVSMQPVSSPAPVPPPFQQTPPARDPAPELEPQKPIPEPPPHTLAEVSQAQTVDRMITIKNEVRIASDILLVRADEHYVHVKTKHDETMFRMKISHLVPNIPEPFGMMVHRSYWVAFEFIEVAVRERDGKLALTLKDGQKILVPRARAKDVEAAWRLSLANSTGDAVRRTRLEPAPPRR